MDMTPKLEQLKNRHEELANLLGQPDATEDMARYTAMNKEYAELTPVVEAFEVYKKMLTEKADLEEMLADSDADAEMKELAEADLSEIREKLPAIEKDLQLRLLPKDADDDKNIIVEVRAGTGGDEAALFVADLFRMYSRYAETKGWKVEVMDASDTGIGGYKEIIANISGQGVFARLKFESGVHRVQRVPETESQGRIHTSAVTVAILPEAEDVDIKVDPNDLRIDVFRASGPGGQSVNTTDSAVRITHVPTGVVVQCQDEKSQHKNRDKAMKVLKARLYDLEAQKAAAERSADRKSQVGSGDRSERIRTYNFPQSRVTDHRINLTSHNLDGILAGEGLDEVIDALTRADQAERLSALGEEAA